jgi:hypothetical protein
VSLSPEVQALGAAVQAFVAQQTEGALVSQALVVWEAVSFADDGEPERQISYACPTDNFSLSGGLGLLEAGRHYIRRDILGSDDDA